MKCPICQSTLTITKLNGITRIGAQTYSYEIECPASPKNKSNHVYGLQDRMEPDNILYVISVKVDDITYAWESSHNSNSTRISVVNKDENGDIVRIGLLTRLNEYYPLRDNTEQYQEIIRRILNLKAFL